LTTTERGPFFLGISCKKKTELGNFRKLEMQYLIFVSTGTNFKPSKLCRIETIGNVLGVIDS
jgi:hypothetical protein